MTSLRFLITGSEGFIGRAVVARAAAAGHTVLGLDVIPPGNNIGPGLAKYHQMKLPSGHASSLVKELKPEVIIHCAGRASVPLSMSDPTTDFETSVTTTFELLDALRRESPRTRFLFLSSAAVYGNPPVLPVQETTPTVPLSPYGFHKLMAEQCCLEFAKIYGIHTISARVFSAYGPGLKRQVIWDICRKAISEPELLLQGTGDETRDFIFSDDLAEALLCLALNSTKPGATHNVASGEETPIRDIAANCLHLLDSHKSLRFDGKLPQGTPSRWRADISSLKQLGFRPSVPFAKGLERFVKWFKATECR